MSSAKLKVVLEPNSLYIATQALPSGTNTTGKFHWAFYLTDANNHAYKHHWAEDRYHRNRVHDRGLVVDRDRKAEKYVCEDMGVPMTRHGSDTLAFFKVEGYKPPAAAEAADVNLRSFAEVCDKAFPSGVSYATVEMNRANGISCRTWIFKVLQELSSKGVVERTGRVHVLELEGVITDASQKYASVYWHKLDRCFEPGAVAYSASVVVI